MAYVYKCAVSLFRLYTEESSKIEEKLIDYQV